MSFHTLAHKLTELKRLAPPCCPSGPTSPLAPQGHGRHSPALAEGNDDPRPRQRGPARRSPGWGLLQLRVCEAEGGPRPRGGSDPGRPSGRRPGPRAPAPIPNSNEAGAAPPLQLTPILFSPPTKRQKPATPIPGPTRPGPATPLRPAASPRLPTPTPSAYRLPRRRAAHAQTSPQPRRPRHCAGAEPVRMRTGEAKLAAPTPCPVARERAGGL